MKIEHYQDRYIRIVTIHPAQQRIRVGSIYKVIDINYGAEALHGYDMNLDARVFLGYPNEPRWNVFFELVHKEIELKPRLELIEL